MKILKKREKPLLLRQLEALDKRMVLGEEFKGQLMNIQRGHQGEDGLDDVAEASVDVDALALDDLLFTEKGSSFQVDKIILANRKCHLIEVKNFSGNYQVAGNKFLTLSGKELTNPLLKFEEKTTKMRNLLNKWNSNLTLEPAIVFVHPDFTLYGAPADPSIVFPNQINAYFSRLNRQWLPLGEAEYQCAEQMLKDHRDEAAFQRKLPEYSFDSLKKGLWCLRCESSILSLTQRSCCCHSCGSRISIEETVLSHIGEFKLLFPHSPVTRNVIYVWCGEVLPPKRIWSILRENFKGAGFAKSSHYL